MRYKNSEEKGKSSLNERNKPSIKKCPNCRRYTLRETCPICGSTTVSPHPPPYKFREKYRILLANYIVKKRGLIKPRVGLEPT